MRYWSFGWLAIVVLLAGCMTRDPAGGSPQPADPAHSSRNVIDWPGTYEGVLPCADCPGVRMRVTLRRDGSYELSRQYIDRDREPRIVSGRFSWLPGGDAITLDPQHGGQRYSVGESKLTLLGADAAPTSPTSQQQARYVLGRVADAAGPGLARTLESHRWTLASATDAQGRRLDEPVLGAGRPVVFAFADARLNIEGGCNRLFAGYRVDGQRLAVERLASTRMACEPAAMKVDSMIGEWLAQPATVQVTPGAEPRLRLVTASGVTLDLTGRLTPTARYGKPTLVFLEVAAQAVPCPKPPAGASACLQVRERRYDAQGLQVGAPGTWQPFAEPIEGYTHQPGVRNVLRIQRFDRTPAAVGAPSFVYVLDLVVESQTAP